MKKNLIICFAALILSACGSIESEKIEEGHTWKLIETKVSIGGPAEFTPVTNPEYIQFLSDSEVIKNNGWCGEGRERTVNYSENGTIYTHCNGAGELKFEIQGDIMIVRNPACIESCEYKYKKVLSSTIPES